VDTVLAGLAVIIVLVLRRSLYPSILALTKRETDS